MAPPEELYVLLVVVAVSSLLLPTSFANFSSFTGVCSKRAEQRLLLPTPESAGHFLQGAAGILLLSHSDIISSDFLPLHLVSGSASLLLVAYPVYNLVKRLTPGKGLGLGLNNTSYGNNLLDFALGTWVAVAAVLLLKRKKANNRTPSLVVVSVLGVVFLVSLFHIKPRRQYPDPGGGCA